MSDENFPLSERPPREGEPWTPEENLLVLAEQPTPPAAFEAFEAIRQLRETAVNAVAAFHLPDGPVERCDARAGRGSTGRH
jgi:hypothetical protein